MIPKLPNLHINSEDFNNPWHVPSNAKGNGRAHWHHDPVSDPNIIHSAIPNTIYSAIPNANHSQSDINETQENHGENLYDYAGGANHLTLNTPSPSCNPQGHHRPPKPTQQPISHLHSSCPPSHQGSVQPHLPPSPQGSAQLHLPPSCQGSAQPQLHHGHQGSAQPSTHSCHSSVNPPSTIFNTMNQYEPEDEVLIYDQDDIGEEEVHFNLSRKWSYTKFTQSSDGESSSETQLMKAKQMPQVPIWPPWDASTFAGPSSGTLTGMPGKSYDCNDRCNTCTRHEWQWSYLCPWSQCANKETWFFAAVNPRQKGY